ncbi:unnamed protein product [Closterium sp. Naga37s-1]|nr:unnamed protein product [Closterium sp. Naga37s-1]
MIQLSTPHSPHQHSLSPFPTSPRHASTRAPYRGPTPLQASHARGSLFRPSPALPLATPPCARAGNPQSGTSASAAASASASAASSAAAASSSNGASTLVKGAAVRSSRLDPLLVHPNQFQAAPLSRTANRLPRPPRMQSSARPPRMPRARCARRRPPASRARPGLIERCFGPGTAPSVAEAASSLLVPLAEHAVSNWALPSGTSGGRSGSEARVRRAKREAQNLEEEKLREERRRELSALVEQLEAIREHAMELEMCNQHHLDLSSPYAAAPRPPLPAPCFVRWSWRCATSIPSPPRVLLPTPTAPLKPLPPPPSPHLSPQSPPPPVSPPQAVPRVGSQPAALHGAAQHGRAAPAAGAREPGAVVAGRTEAHTLASIHAVTRVVRSMLRELSPNDTSSSSASASASASSTSSPAPASTSIKSRANSRNLQRTCSPPVLDFADGDRQLQRNTVDLLGAHPPHRKTFIMVTLPVEAAADRALVAELLRAGMNVARVNCAHDDPVVWGRIMANVRKLSAQLGRPCRFVRGGRGVRGCEGVGGVGGVGGLVLMDLAGPKLRTGCSWT